MEEKKHQPVLVPVDFSGVGESALQHGIEIARISGCEMILLHAVDSNTESLFGDKNAKEEARRTLAGIAENVMNSHGIKCHIHIEGESYCGTVNNVSEEKDALLVVLGVHGRHDIQYLTPKYAMRFIRLSRIPYIVVQRNSYEAGRYKKVVVSINHMKETKEKIAWSAFFGKKNGSSIHLVIANEKDPKTQNNLAFAKKILTEFNTPFLVHETQKSWMQLDRHALDYAKEINAGLYIIMTATRYSWLDNLWGHPETGIISNKYNIPVLCLNPRKDLYVPCV